jgi:formamidopyrimidine-DNA glycosylase
LRTVTPKPSDLVGRAPIAVSRLGKRIVFAFAKDLFVVVHLMIAGRFRWIPNTAHPNALAADRKPGKPRPSKPSKEGDTWAPPPIPGKLGLTAFDFETGTLILTEASTKKRASIHLATELTSFDRGGLEVMEAELPAFILAMTRTRHTIKRALTDPTILSGIGNAYSDEILHRARLSPFKRTDQLSDSEWLLLLRACQDVLRDWTERLRAEPGFPEKVTAFRPEMAVHGRFKLPCPTCGAPVQRVVYAANEANYCARCQTDGRILMDRSLSRLLKDDWPRTLEELEELHQRA